MSSPGEVGQVDQTTKTTTCYATTRNLDVGATAAIWRNVAVEA